LDARSFGLCGGLGTRFVHSRSLSKPRSVLKP
jgi:hypothetical protein